MQKIVLGIDIGTSGIRACIVKKSNGQKDQILKSESIASALPKQNTQGRIYSNPESWVKCLKEVLKNLSETFDLKKISHIISDATSSTVLLTDEHGYPATQALMYNDNLSTDEADEIVKALQKDNINFSGAIGSSSTLAKSINLRKNLTSHKNNDVYICNQNDYINQFLLGLKTALNTTDENNALKLGFDSTTFCWPNAIIELAEKYKLTLPKVIKPGEELGKVNPYLASSLGVNPEAIVCAGTTDSIAGFLAAGASQVGDAVTSLGSTIAIKVISRQPVFDQKYGLYSHKLKDDWLVGGASNAGGSIFLKYYSTDSLTELCKPLETKEVAQIIGSKKTFYPLQNQGERFPIADSKYLPKMPDLPELPFSFDDQESYSQHREFITNLSLGLAQIEQLAFQRFADIARIEPNTIWTVGGGTKNSIWMQFRKALLQGSVKVSKQQDASYGVTKLIDS